MPDAGAVSPAVLSAAWPALQAWLAGVGVISDPFFYAVAVPAVLLTGLSKSGFASGFGALAVPVMALAVPVPQAAAVFLPLLLVMDATGLQQLWTDRDRAMLRMLLPCAAASGFTSFVAHAGGPPVSAYLLPLRPSPRSMSATLAVFFAVLNASKWLPYALLGLIDQRNLATSLVLMPLAPLGVWAGVRLLRHMQPGTFYAVAYVGMLLTGLKLLWDGLA